MNFKEIGYEDVDWIHLAQDGVQWRALVSRLPSCWMIMSCQFIKIWDRWPGTSLERMKKSSKTSVPLTGFPDEIQTRALPNGKKTYYSW